jgi:Niemann-Pick C1 protein
MSHQLCQSDSIGSLVSNWATEPEETFIATSAMNWVDTYKDWVVNGACCRVYKDKTENGVSVPCPTEEDEGLCEECGIGTNITSLQFSQTIKWFIDANPRESCPNGGHAAHGDGIQIREKAVNTKLQRWSPPVNQTRYEIVHSNMMAFHTILKTSKDYYTALKRARELTDKMTAVMNADLPEEDHVTVFPYSVFYVFYEQYLTMWADAMRSLFISVFSIFIVTLILLGFDVISSLLIVFTIILILTNILAVMKWWSITLNAVSLVNLVMAVGISVEFCSHITR